MALNCTYARSHTCLCFILPRPRVISRFTALSGPTSCLPEESCRLRNLCCVWGMLVWCWSGKASFYHHGDCISLCSHKTNCWEESKVAHAEFRDGDKHQEGRRVMHNGLHRCSNYCKHMDAKIISSVSTVVSLEPAKANMNSIQKSCFLDFPPLFEKGKALRC